MFEDIQKLAIDQVYGRDPHVWAHGCPQCGRLHYPAVLLCKECGARRYPEDEVELVWRKKGYVSWKKVALEGPCRLLTHTRLWALPMDFDERYLDFGIVHFEETGLSAPGLLRVTNPKNGMALVAQVEVLREIRGEPFHGLVFEEASPLS